jgi:hypothetical protein
VATAQHAFDSMLRYAVRPRLRALGFRGSGSTFTWPSKVAFAHIGVQKSQFSDRDALKFTANVTVANIADWERVRQERPRFPRRPAPNTFYGDFIWQRRIGNLTPEGEDLWWWLDADQDWSPVAEEFVRIVEAHVLPELMARA